MNRLKSWIIKRKMNPICVKCGIVDCMTTDVCPAENFRKEKEFEKERKKNGL